MPIVTIQVTREGVTAEQKAELIKGATDLLVRVLKQRSGHHLHRDRRGRHRQLGRRRRAGQRTASARESKVANVAPA